MSEQHRRGAVEVTTAAQLEAMSPADRQSHFEASVVTDLSEVSPPLLSRVRTRLEQRIAAQDPSRSA